MKTAVTHGTFSFSGVSLPIGWPQRWASIHAQTVRVLWLPVDLHEGSITCSKIFKMTVFWTYFVYARVKRGSFIFAKKDKTNHMQNQERWDKRNNYSIDISKCKSKSKPIHIHEGLVRLPAFHEEIYILSIWKSTIKGWQL